jgi:hypothetical protein
MNSRRLAVVVVLCTFAAVASAQDVQNWNAPPYWSPLSAISAGRDTDRASESPRALSVAAALVSTSPLPFIGVDPCRLVDTREAGFPAGYGAPALVGGSPRNFDLNDDPLCTGIPASVGAYSLNITVTNAQGPGFIKIYPQGGAQPPVSTLNYVASQTIANAAIVAAGTGGGVTVIAGVSGTDVIIDINGYYAPAGLNVGTIFNYTGNATVNSTLAISGSTNAASPNQIRAAGPIPVACTLDTFSVFMDTAPTVLTVFTLQRNANDGNGFLNTNATCQIGVGGTVCQAASPSVAFAAGDLAMTSVTGAAGAGGRASVSWRCK